MKRRLVEGKRYDINLPDRILTNYFYAGMEDQICISNCECCGKEISGGHIFMKPTNLANYDECIAGKFENQVVIGSSCVKKLILNDSV